MMSKQIHIHVHRTKDADVRIEHIKSGIAAVKRNMADGERALEKGDLDLAGRHFVSASISLENIGKQARSSA